MKCILAVDDADQQRTIIKAALSDLDVNLVFAEDGKQGLAAVEEHHPDLILLDISMPVMSGSEMLSELMRPRVW